MENHLYISNTVKLIQKDLKNKKTHDELSAKYKDFKEKYPKTWIHIMEGNFSITEVNKMKQI